MGKKHDDDDLFDDGAFDFSEDDFFPGDGASKQGLPVGPLGYAANLGKSVLSGIGGLTGMFVPNLNDIVEEIHSGAEESVDAFIEQKNDIVGTVKDLVLGKDRKSVTDVVKGKFGEVKKDIVKAITTGDFRFKDEVDISKAFGEGFSIDDEDDEDGDGGVKAAMNIHESETDQREKIFEASEVGATKRYYAGEVSTNARHIQSIGYVANIDSNVSKIAGFFSTLGVDAFKAQIEFGEKSLAMQDTTLGLLTDIAKSTSRVNEDEESDKPKGSMLNKIFKWGFNGSEYAKHVRQNIADGLDNVTGGMLGMGKSMAEMNEMGITASSAGNMLMKGLFKSLPKAFMSDDNSFKLDRLNDTIGQMPGNVNSKLVEAGLYSDNPIMRVLGSVLGVKDVSTKGVDLGIKNLHAKAEFDQKFYKTVTDGIPGLLSKILSQLSGEEEQFYDHKSGRFKKSSQLLREFEQERKDAYEGGAEYKQSMDRMKSRVSDIGEKTDQDPTSIAKDFDQIADNIVATQMHFNPTRAATDKNYQAKLTKGLKNPNNLFQFIREFADEKGVMTDEDRMTFATGINKKRMDVNEFNTKGVKDFVDSSSGGVHVVEKLNKEHVSELVSNLDMIYKEENFKDPNSFAALKAKSELLDAKEDLFLKHGYRDGDSLDLDTDNEQSTKLLSKSPADQLSKIYELLLGGIIVYPDQRGVPDHLKTRIKDHNDLIVKTAKDASVDKFRNDEMIKELDKLRDENEMSRAVKEQGANIYGSHALEGLLNFVGEKLGFKKSITQIKEESTDLKDFNGAISTNVDKVQDFMYKMIYGKNLKHKDPTVRSINQESAEKAKEAAKSIDIQNIVDNALDTGASSDGSDKKKKRLNKLLAGTIKPLNKKELAEKAKLNKAGKYLYRAHDDLYGEKLSIGGLNKAFKAKALGPIVDDKVVTDNNPNSGKLFNGDENYLSNMTFDSGKEPSKIEEILTTMSSKFDSLLSSIGKDVNSILKAIIGKKSTNKDKVTDIKPSIPTVDTVKDSSSMDMILETMMEMYTIKDSLSNIDTQLGSISGAVFGIMNNTNILKSINKGIGSVGDGISTLIEKITKLPTTSKENKSNNRYVRSSGFNIGEQDGASDFMSQGVSFGTDMGDFTDNVSKPSISLDNKVEEPVKQAKVVNDITVDENTDISNTLSDKLNETLNRLITNMVPQPQFDGNISNTSVKLPEDTSVTVKNFDQTKLINSIRDIYMIKSKPTTEDKLNELSKKYGTGNDRNESINFTQYTSGIESIIKSIERHRLSTESGDTNMLASGIVETVKAIALNTDTMITLLANIDPKGPGILDKIKGAGSTVINGTVGGTKFILNKTKNAAKAIGRGIKNGAVATKELLIDKLDVIGKISGGASWAGRKIKDLGKATLSKTNELWKWMLSKRPTKEQIEEFKGKVGAFAQSSKEKLISAKDWMGDKLRKGKEWLKSKDIKGKAGAAVDWTVDKARGAKNWVKNRFSKNPEDRDPNKPSLWQRIKGGVKGGYDKVKTHIANKNKGNEEVPHEKSNLTPKDALNAILDEVIQIRSNMGNNAGKGIFGKIFSTIGAITGGFKQGYSNATGVTPTKPTVESVNDTKSVNNTNTPESVKEPSTVKEKVENAKRVFKSKVSKVAETTKPTVDKAKEVVKSVIAGKISTKAKPVIDKVKNVVSKVKDSIKPSSNTTKEPIKSINNGVKFIKGPVKSLDKANIDKVGLIKNAIKTKLTTPTPPTVSSHDADGDGDRDGSIKDQQQRAKEASEKSDRRKQSAIIKRISDNLEGFTKPRKDLKKEAKIQAEAITGDMEKKGLGKGGGGGFSLTSLPGLLGYGAKMLPQAAKFGIGGAASVGLAGAAGYNLLKKSQMGKEQGLDKGSLVDKVNYNTGIDDNSQYGYDGRELSAAEQSANSTSATKVRAPTLALMGKGFKGMVDGASKMGSITKNVVKDDLARTVANGGVSGKLAEGASSVGRFAKGAFDRLVKKPVTGMAKNVAKGASGVAKKAAVHGGNIITKIIELITKCFTKAPLNKLINKKMADGIIKALPKILTPKFIATHAAEIGAKFIKFLAGPVSIALLVNDFITGMSSTNRYFDLGKGAKAEIDMVISSGVANLLSSLVFGLIPAKWISKFIFGIIGNKFQKDYVEKYGRYMEAKAKGLGVDKGRLTEYETKNMWQTLASTDKRNAKLLGFKTPEEYIRWKTDKYEPFDKDRKKLIKLYRKKGNISENVLEGVPHDEGTANIQSDYRGKLITDINKISTAADKKWAEEDKKAKLKKSLEKDIKDGKLSLSKQSLSDSDVKDPKDTTNVGDDKSNINTDVKKPIPSTVDGDTKPPVDTSSAGEVVDKVSKTAVGGVIVAGANKVPSVDTSSAGEVVDKITSDANNINSIKDIKPPVDTSSAGEVVDKITSDANNINSIKDIKPPVDGLAKPVSEANKPIKEGLPTKAAATSSSNSIVDDIKSKANNQADNMVKESVGEKVPTNKDIKDVSNTDKININKTMMITSSIPPLSKASEVVKPIYDEDNATKPVINDKKSEKVENIIDKEASKNVSTSPVSASMDKMTKDIYNELDALKAIFAEDVRHNSMAERFYSQMLTLMSTMVKSSKASLVSDSNRNDLASKQLVASTPSLIDKVAGGIGDLAAGAGTVFGGIAQGVGNAVGGVVDALGNIINGGNQQGGMNFNVVDYNLGDGVSGGSSTPTAVPNYGNTPNPTSAGYSGQGVPYAPTGPGTQGAAPATYSGQGVPYAPGSGVNPASNSPQPVNVTGKPSTPNYSNGSPTPSSGKPSSGIPVAADNHAIPTKDPVTDAINKDMGGKKVDKVMSKGLDMSAVNKLIKNYEVLKREPVNSGDTIIGTRTVYMPKPGTDGKRHGDVLVETIYKNGSSSMEVDNKTYADKYKVTGDNFGVKTKAVINNVVVAPVTKTPVATTSSYKTPTYGNVATIGAGGVLR